MKSQRNPEAGIIIKNIRRYLRENAKSKITYIPYVRVIIIKDKFNRPNPKQSLLAPVLHRKWCAVLRHIARKQKANFLAPVIGALNRFCIL